MNNFSCWSSQTSIIDLARAMFPFSRLLRRQLAILASSFSIYLASMISLCSPWREIHPWTGCRQLSTAAMRNSNRNLVPPVKFDCISALNLQRVKLEYKAKLYTLIPLQILTAMSDRDFIVLSKLGEGTYGEVFKVKRISDNEVYAMKKVKIMDLKEKDKRNALNEIRILASIDHPNIVQYKEAFFDESSNKMCTIMELAPGGDLSAQIRNKFKKGDGFYEYQIWRYGLNILEGIKHLHSLNIIHRDLKPANIFFGTSDVLKIGDMNVSRHLSSNLAHTQTGTPNYASPEIWNNEAYSFQCDIWSFGCLIYEMCCFRPPFRSKNMDELFQKVQSGVYDKIPKRYSLMLEDAISKCLQKREKRAKVDELINIFEKYSSVKIIKKCHSANNLLQTIEFPKNKKDFSTILPSPKYVQKCSEPNPESPKKKISAGKESILDNFLKEPVSSLLQRRRLSNKVYYDGEACVKISKSEKVINNLSNIDKPSVVRLQEKNLSFRQILKSLEEAKITNIARPLEKMNMRRRHMRMGLQL